MPLLAEAGHSPEQLQWLTLVRIYQQVLFLLGILTASGRLIEHHTMQPRLGEALWSCLCFPLQSPTQEDFKYWRESTKALHPIWGMGIRMGPYHLSGHQIWDWWHNKEHGLLLYHHNETM